MPVATNIYRRCAIYWWRHSARWPIPGGDHIKLSISLLTKDAGEARVRAAALMVWSRAVQTSILEEWKRDGLSSEQRDDLYRREISSYRDTLARDPNEARRFGGGFTVESSLEHLERGWARMIPMPPMSELKRDHVEAALRDDDAEFAERVRAHVVDPAFRADITQKGAELLATAGLASNRVRAVIGPRIVIAARATAARAHRLGEPMPSASPPATRELPNSVTLRPFPIVAAIPAFKISYSPTAATVVKQPASAALVPKSMDIAQAVPVVDGNWDKLTPSEVATLYLDSRSDGLDYREGGKRQPKKLDEHTKRQVRWAATLLEKSMNPDPARLVRPLAELSQGDLETLDKHFEKLPTSVGKSSWDRLAGTTLTMISDRAEARLKQISDRDAARPNAKETTRSQIGLDVETTNKHFRKISILVDFIRAHVPDMATLNIDKFIDASDRDERDEREAYTVEQMTELFSLPPWTGCLDAGNRLVKGTKRFADALVFVLLMVWYTGVRREELCKLLVSEVKQYREIWYLDIKTSDAGRIKNARSRRYVVICEELLRLGFLSYFEAIKAAGYTALFPELITESGKSKKGDVFYRVWWVKLKVHMTSLLPGQALHSARHAFDTELKELEVFPEFREDAAGRKGNRGETDRYAKATRLRKLSDLFNKVPCVTGHLDPFLPAELLPAQMLRPRPARRVLGRGRAGA